MEKSSRRSDPSQGAQPDGAEPPAEGLRSRKKAKRRDDILMQARSLFAETGVDAVTMSEIAQAAGVSTPTVFNYFGNKDGILIALITEGTQKARENSKVLEPRTDVDFLTTLMTVFLDVSSETLAIARKRIWRYAQAATIRHPDTDIARSLEEIDAALLQIVERILSRYELTLHDGSRGDPRVVAHLFLDVWMTTFHAFVRAEDMTLETHEKQLHARFAPLCRMIFAPAFLARPTLAEDRA
ncbi:TetR/AcrR family transcriptional regulator [Litorisediminicola beolgyonensis]|uniref:TetR/AcrR family transcriptional regulator n=1 Tax=Litorisediminicola beolgyonensis TaxID=1173614 RepID=A0ABW3ZGQ5_9RHOB